MSHRSSTLAASIEARVTSEDTVENLTLRQLEVAGGKLRERVDELRRFGTEQVSFFDARVDLAMEEILRDVVAIFGVRSSQHQQLRPLRDWPADEAVAMSDSDKQDAFEAGVAQMVAVLERHLGSVDKARERLRADPTRALFLERAIHPRIAASCIEEFRDGRQSRGVFAAAMALQELIREKSGEQMDGVDLMGKVFGGPTPVLHLNARVSVSEQSEQRGFAKMLEGVVLALRNPRAHGPVTDSPELALDYLGVISMLAKHVDAATKPIP